MNKSSLDRVQNLSIQRHVVNLHKLSDFGNPAALHKGRVIWVIAVESVCGCICELHGETQGEVVLGAGLTQAFELLHAGDLGEFTEKTKGAVQNESQHAGGESPRALLP